MKLSVFAISLNSPNEREARREILGLKVKSLEVGTCFTHTGRTSRCTLLSKAGNGWKMGRDDQSMT